MGETVQWIPTANWQSNFKHYRTLERWVALVRCTCAMLMLRVMELTIIADSGATGIGGTGGVCR